MPLFLVSTVIAFALYGCATVPLPPDTQARLGTAVTIVVSSSVKTPRVQAPLMRYRHGPGFSKRVLGAGYEALNGMNVGATWAGEGIEAIEAGGSYPDFYTVAAHLAVVATGATLGGLMGVVHGFLNGTPEVPAEIVNVLERDSVAEALQDRVYRTLSAVPSYHFSKASRSLYKSRTPRELYPSRLFTVLQLTILKIALVGTADTAPHRLTIRVRSQLLDANGVIVYDSRAWQYYSEEHPLAAWQADEASLLRTELTRFYDDIAKRASAELFYKSQPVF